MSIEKSAFARKFEDLARDRRMTFKVIAEQMQVSAALIARVLNGSRPPTSEFVDKSIQTFGLSERDAEQLRFFSDISQSKITIRPRNEEEARKVVAFKRSLQKG
ncbi:helix-turn-helix domain-containing protein [uncultured Sulfitobacter sp.]|uniref:helix-turn-helix domain-containing protein n=1 Tax=uncultured Sulfitobacter sp. TaxID=191468 RepID=UPI002631C80D|nr:helix-turn-helix domain-containing protein [uncultured Sulfitobacter sp.]